jgi:hypothetical protein
MTKKLHVTALVLVPIVLFFLISDMIARRPVSVRIGTVRNAVAEPVALRALAKQLPLYPRAAEVKVVWQHAETTHPSYAGSMNFSRASSSILFTPNDRKQALEKRCSVDGEQGIAYSAKEGQIVGTCDLPFG